MFTFPTEDTQKSNTCSFKSANTSKTSSNKKKKEIRILISDNLLKKSPNFIKFGWVAKKL